MRLFRYSMSYSALLGFHHPYVVWTLRTFTSARRRVDFSVRFSADGQEGVVKGAVETVVFRAPTGYTIAKLRLTPLQLNEPSNGASIASFKRKASATGDLVTVVAATHLAAVVKGDMLACSGRWIKDVKWGLRLNVDNVLLEKRQAETPEAATKAWLLSGALPGIGPKIAERILDVFGDRTQEVVGYMGHDADHRKVQLSYLLRRGITSSFFQSILDFSRLRAKVD
jgi:hypothetical protein